MKPKSEYLIFILPLLIISAVTAYAESTITGAAYGQNMGLIHFDYTTADSPFAVCNLESQDSGNPNCPISAEYDDYHFGLRKDFFISTDDPDYVAVPNPSYISTISDIGDPGTYPDTCNTITQLCTLHGFVWNDAIGWIIVDGEVIKNNNGSPITFPEASYAQVSYAGLFTGYIWSKHAGWIKLSSDVPPVTAGEFIPAESQTATQWGVWMYTDECGMKEDEAECDTRSEICQWNVDVCEDSALPNGRQLHGNAWSEKLGWIKFDKGAGDEFDFNVYTSWIPDLSPPVLNVIEDDIWFANDSALGTVSWPQFAIDPQSGINSVATTINVTLDTSADFAGCADVINTNQTIDGNELTVNIPLVGMVDGAPKGFCMYTIDGTLVNEAGLTTVVAPITFYVRAGDLDMNKSSFTLSDNASAVADGNENITYVFAANDIAGNSIVPVKVDRIVNMTGGVVNEEANPDDWMRDIDNIFSLESDFYFDAINNTSISIPTLINSVTYLQSDRVLNHIFSPSDGTHMDPEIGGTYDLQVAAYAPTTNCGDSCINSFILDGASFEIIDAEMPAITDPDDTDAIITVAYNPTYTIDSTTAFGAPNPLAATLVFTPALTISDGELEDNIVIIGANLDTIFTVNNNSTLTNIQAIAVDSIMNFENVGAGAGFGEEVLDFRNITLSTDADTYFGRTDPISLEARYEFGSDASPQITSFHSDLTNYHDPVYSFQFDVGTPSSVTSNGYYDVEGAYDFTMEEILDPPETYDDIHLDRTDVLSGFDLASMANQEFTINFTPVQIIGHAFTKNVEFNMDQYLAYMIPGGIGEFAIYEAGTTIDGVAVKNVGLQSPGIVTGKHIFETVGGREFEAFTSTGSGNLKKILRGNAQNLIRNLPPCTANQTLESLTTVASGCVKVDDSNQTIVAVYEGDEDDLLVIGNSADITVPNYRYTIVVKGGANIMFRKNIIYDGANPLSSLGIIVLSNNTETGGNVYVHHDPTNISTMLYTEGSLLSSSDTDASDGMQLYYGPSAGNPDALKNQLYWQGNIVSRNTIGGAPNRVIPDGISCGDISDPFVCAQVYDLDYIRRFYLLTNVNGGYSENGAVFSGGGSCPAGAGTCVSGSLPTVVDVDAGYVDMTDSESTDPFYIKKTNRRAPPGFTTGGGFMQLQEIR